MAVLMRGAGGGFQAQAPGLGGPSPMGGGGAPGKIAEGAGAPGSRAGLAGGPKGPGGDLKGLLSQKYQQQGVDESTSLSDTTKALTKAALGGGPGQPQPPAGGVGLS